MIWWKFSQLMFYHLHSQPRANYEHLIIIELQKNWSVKLDSHVIQLVSYFPASLLLTKLINKCLRFSHYLIVIFFKTACLYCFSSCNSETASFLATLTSWRRRSALLCVFWFHYKPLCRVCYRKGTLMSYYFSKILQKTHYTVFSEWRFLSF